MAAPMACNKRQQPLVFFGGYSNSGKTTHCIPILRSFGYRILSSSVLLHDFSDRLVSQVFGCHFFDSYDRELELVVNSQLKSKEAGLFFGNVTFDKAKYKAKSRQFLIDLAEKALVPVFTRGVFVNAIADLILQNPDVCYAIEVFNAEEFARLKHRLVFEDHVIFNLRRQSENPCVDKRTLIPGGVDIHNNGSYAELELDLRVFLDAEF